MKIIAITGGIGSGKSVVSRILRTMEYRVYDCDCEAKSLMNSDVNIKKEICYKIDSKAVKWCDGKGEIDRKHLAHVVFSNPEKLNKLNKIVHAAVKKDLSNKIAEYKEKNEDGIYFFETAILFESHFDSIADKIWVVSAPKEIRLLRLEKRGMQVDDAISRISAQEKEEKRILEEDCSIILNDGLNPILPEIISLIDNF